MRGKAFPLGSAKNTTVFVFAIPHSPRGSPPKTPRKIFAQTKVNGSMFRFLSVKEFYFFFANIAKSRAIEAIIATAKAVAPAVVNVVRAKCKVLSKSPVTAARIV